MRREDCVTRPRAGWKLFVTRKLCHLLFAGIAALLILRTQSGPVVNWRAVAVGIVYGLALVAVDLTIRPRCFSSVSRDCRSRRIGSLTWGVIGCTCALVIGGSKLAAWAAVLLGVCDAVAGSASLLPTTTPLVFNRRKSVEGSLMGLVTCLVITALWAPNMQGVCMAIGACFAEGRCDTLDDNLAIPIVATSAGLLTTIIQRV